MSAEITSGDLDQFKQDLQATPGANALQKAVMNNGINDRREYGQQSCHDTNVLN